MLFRSVWWIPDLSDLRKQAWSMGSRFFLAYVLLITAWVALLLVVGARVEKEDPEMIPINEAPPSSASPGPLGAAGS